MNRQLRPPTAAAWLWIVSVCLTASAAKVDLSLNLIYSNPASSASSGTWQVVAKSDGFGIAALRVLLTGDAQVSAFGVPTGTISGSNPAGFVIREAADFGDFIDLTLSQAVTPNPGQTGVFYGVGTLQNGAPNYPSRPAGTNIVAGSPSLTTLAGVTGVPWAINDPLGQAAWNTGALVASGSFAAGQAPAFFTGPGETSLGSVYTSVGTLSTIGATSDFATTTITTVVRSNLTQSFPDYNGNGVVDAADYTVWRDSLGRVVTPGSGADGDRNGVIGQGDYDLWKLRFGSTAAVGVVGGGEVPEASSLAVLGLVLTGSLGWGSRGGWCTRGFFAGISSPSGKTGKRCKNCLTPTNRPNIIRGVEATVIDVGSLRGVDCPAEPARW